MEFLLGTLSGVFTCSIIGIYLANKLRDDVTNEAINSRLIVHPTGLYRVTKINSSVSPEIESECSAFNPDK